MKGGNCMELGEVITKIPNNSNPVQQYPVSSNLNSSIPLSYQNGGSLLDTFGMGDVSILKNTIINSAKNAIALTTGTDSTISNNPAIHPEISKSLVKFPTPIDVKGIHAQHTN